ncbi:MAG TPA: hypothetical protein VMT18_02235, partial [Planctomycetota bacterium]|nr:hypothetical protein [Planctomycetota bacterium]
MRIGRKGQGRERGSVMFAALAVVLTITVLASCLLQISSINSREQSRSIDTKRAFYLAEAGLSEAWYGLKVGNSGNIGTADLPASYGDGVLWVEAEDAGDGRVSLTSTGLAGSGRFSLSMVVERDGTSVAGLGVFADQDVVIGGGVLIDSYDSSVGPYTALVGEVLDPLVNPLSGLDGVVEGVVAGNGGSTSRVGSNGDIIVSGSPSAATTITGDVQPGPTGSVIIGEGVTIAGSTAPSSKPCVLPEIDVPVIASSGDMTVGARGSLSELPTGDRAYGLLRVPTGKTLTIHGPTTLVVSRFQLDPGANLILNAGLGPIEIYATTELTWAPDSNVSCLHDSPANLALLVSASTPIDRDGDGEVESPTRFQPTGAYLGTVYAPHSQVEIAAATEVFGAIAAQGLTLADGVKVHFDEALAAFSNSPDGELVVTAWRVMELPDVPLVKDHRDPLIKLLTDGVVIPMASQAHEAILFKIRFMSWADQVTTWSGDESRFDWL